MELGAWVGVLVNGLLADSLGRQNATLIGTIVFVVGVIVQACAKGVDYILGGRFVTGLGVGILSMIVPLYGYPKHCPPRSSPYPLLTLDLYRYNAELAPSELRGSLVSLQQLAICFGIMVSYWIGMCSICAFPKSGSIDTEGRLWNQLYRRNWLNSVKCGVVDPDLYSDCPGGCSRSWNYLHASQVCSALIPIIAVLSHADIRLQSSLADDEGQRGGMLNSDCEPAQLAH